MARVPESATPPALLPTSHGWRPPVGAPLELLLGEQAFSVRPLGRRAGLVALLCEAPLGAPLPEYSTRRSLRARLDGHFARHLTVFTDAAHQQRVWTWVQRPRRGPPAYRESSTPPRPEELGRGAPRPAGAGTPPDGRQPSDAVLAWVELRLLPRGRAAGTHSDPVTAVQALVERVDHPHRLRRIWGTLLRLRVLDPACGRGDWLLAAMADLEPAYLACLERMRSFVSDQDRATPRSRRLQDFRELLRLADGGERYPTARHFVRATIALFNLHGADASATCLARCRRRIRARCPATLPAAALQLALGDPRRGLAHAEEVLRAGPAPEGERLLEEVRLLARADHVLRRTTWTTGQVGVGLDGAFARLRRRRRTLSAVLDRRLAEYQGIDVRRAGAFRAWRGATRPAHPLVTFPLLSEESRGTLVRGGAP